MLENYNYCPLDCALYMLVFYDLLHIVCSTDQDCSVGEDHLEPESTTSSNENISSSKLADTSAKNSVSQVSELAQNLSFD